MDRSKTINLISEAYTEDEYGVLKPTRTKRQVFCNVSSVSASEWFEGSRAGLNPEWRFTMFAPDYQGEEIVEFSGVQYSIYRTYHARNDTIELYAELRKGVQIVPTPTPTPDPDEEGVNEDGD